VKVDSRVLSVPSRFGRILVAIPLAIAISFGAMPAPAQAITRPAVLKRANHWIKHRVKYSQHRYYRGYRRDCSGFVSMAWKLKKSYTSSTIRSRAKKISWRKLRPGDAVRRRGHVEIFGGWKNKKHRRYYALEESTWGKPARRRVKTFKRGYSALRFRGIKERKIRLIAKVTPARPPVVTMVRPAVAAAVMPVRSVERSVSALTALH
jgi:hypothetical protein